MKYSSKLTENINYPVDSVTYFGGNHKIIEAINSITPVQTVVVESRHFNEELFNLIKLRDVKLLTIQSSKEYEKIANQITGQLGISYGFGVIFKKTDISRFKYGIWNIHSGKLPDVRGRHPVSWGFLRNDFEFWVSIHEINEQIDQGQLLAEDFIRRSITDTEVDISLKLENILAENLIAKAFRNYFNGNKTMIKEGHYYESLIGKLENLEPAELSSVYVFNAFKSQARYGGINVNGVQYKKCVFINEEFLNLYSGYDIFTCGDNVKVGLS